MNKARKIGVISVGAGLAIPLLVFLSLIGTGSTLDLGSGLFFFFIFVPFCALLILGGAVIFFVGVARERRERSKASGSGVPLPPADAKGGVRAFQWALVVIALLVCLGVPFLLGVLSSGLGGAFAH